MLNICMERRRIREGGLPFAMTAATGSRDKKRSDSFQEDSDDEFYDCSDEEDKGMGFVHKYAAQFD